MPGHLDRRGGVRMVDVGDKPSSCRTATASGILELTRKQADALAGLSQCDAQIHRGRGLANATLLIDDRDRSHRRKLHSPRWITAGRPAAPLPAAFAAGRNGHLIDWRIIAAPTANVLARIM